MAVISQSRVTGDVEGGAPAGLPVKPGVVLRPQLLEPEIEEAAWGSRDVLPWLLELPNPQQRPQAWVHYRPVGAGSAPGGLRVVAVDTPYPLGVRPTAAQALAGFQAEEQAGLAVDAAQRLFPDAVGGAVSMVALTPMVLLAGHRPLAEVGALINLLGLRALAPWVTRLVTEGEPAKISEIHVVGNKAFSESTLKKQLDLDTGGWMSWYTKSDRYARSKLNADN